MGELLLYAIFLVVVALTVIGFYRLAAEPSRGKTSKFYDLGTPCLEGAASAPCPHCGQLFGSTATEEARQKCERELRSTSSRNEGSGNLLDLIQSIWWNLNCPSCGEQSSYVPQARLLLYQRK